MHLFQPSLSLLISLLLGLFYSDYNEFTIITSDLEYLFAFFIKLVGFFSFGLFLGILVKRSAFAIGAMVVWWIGEKIIWLIGLWFFRASKEAMEAASKVTAWFPLEAMSNLIKEPGSRLGVVKTIANQMGGFTKSYAVAFKDVAIVSVWTFIFIYGCICIVKKAGFIVDFKYIWFSKITLIYMKNLPLILFIFLTLNVYAQKEANIWYFGENAGLNFNTSPPQALADGQLSTREGCSSFSDANGELLFYSDGTTVYDKNHNIMTYSDGRLANDLRGNSSSTQSGMIVPKPKSSTIFYLFTVGPQQW